MIRNLVFVTLGVLAMHAAAQAGPVLSLDGLPTTLSPGSQFSFDVRLTDAEDVNSYFVELALESGDGVAETDFDFVGATEPSSDYIFGDSSLDPIGFFASTTVESSSRLRISLSDFLFGSNAVDTTAGEDDRLATVTIRTNTMVESLHISFDTTFLTLLNPSFAPVPEFDSLQTSSHELKADTPVPEPSALLLSLLGGAGLYLARRRADGYRRDARPPFGEA